MASLLSADLPHVGPTQSRTQLRRAQRLHTLQSYRKLKSKLVAALRPVPAGIDAVDLEVFRQNLHAETLHTVRAKHLATDVGRSCTLCGIWEPFQLSLETNAGTQTASDGFASIPAIANVSPIMPTACEVPIGKDKLDRSSMLTHLAERSKKLGHQISIIRTMYQTAFLRDVSDDPLPDDTVDEYLLASPSSSPCAEVSNVGAQARKERYERIQRNLAPYLNFHWTADTVPFSAYPENEVHSLLSAQKELPLMDPRAILFARHIKGYQVRSEPDDSSADDCASDLANFSGAFLSSTPLSASVGLQPIVATPLPPSSGELQQECKQQ